MKKLQRAEQRVVKIWYRATSNEVKKVRIRGEECSEDCGEQSSLWYGKVESALK